MSNKFQLWMRSVDDDLLEEAMTPVKRKSMIPWIAMAAAACLLLVLGLPLLQDRSPEVTAAQLSNMGYDMKLPEAAEQISYDIVKLADRDGAQASFMIQQTQYVYQAVKTPEQHRLAEISSEEEQVLTWDAGNLNIQLRSSSSSTSVSWYTPENQTQWYLTAAADAQEVLTTASQILRSTGLDVTVAPDDAENITYNAFLLDDLTVAETTFRIGGTTYAYRMAATLEIREDFADISGLTDSFENQKTSEVFWCSAKLAYNDDGQGKIIWFDLVPGILYSLTMDSGASEEALLDMANSLFVPAQDNN